MHEAIIDDIRHRLALGHSGAELARVYQVDAAVITRIKLGRCGVGCTDPEGMSDRLERLARKVTRYIGKRRLRKSGCPKAA